VKGTGGIKPNVSSFGADQFPASHHKEVLSSHTVHSHSPLELLSSPSHAHSHLHSFPPLSHSDGWTFTFIHTYIHSLIHSYTHALNNTLTYALIRAYNHSCTAQLVSYYHVFYFTVNVGSVLSFLVSVSYVCHATIHCVVCALCMSCYFFSRLLCFQVTHQSINQHHWNLLVWYTHTRVSIWFDSIHLKFYIICTAHASVNSTFAWICGLSSCIRSAKRVCVCEREESVCDSFIDSFTHSFIPF